MELAHLDWEVTAEPIRTDFGVVDGYSAIVREDRPATVLGIVGDGYEIIQNRAAFDFTEALLETGALYESAGALGRGERVWVLARIPQADFEVGNGDQHQSFLCFATSHDSSLAATVKVTDVRVVCQNTLAMALHGNGANLKIRHTKTASDRLNAAQRMVSNTVQSSRSLADKMQLLAKRRLTRASIGEILDKLFPRPAEGASQARRDNMLADVLAAYEHNDGDAFPEQRGTAYNLLNAITNYTDHVRGARITDNRAGMSLQQARAENAMFGTGARLKEQALDVIYQLTDGTEEIRTVYQMVPESPSDLLDVIVSGN